MVFLTYTTDILYYYSYNYNKPIIAFHQMTDSENYGHVALGNCVALIELLTFFYIFCITIKLFEELVLL